MDYVDFCGVLHGLQIAEYSPFNASHLLYVIIHSINFKFRHITYYQVDIFIFNYNCMSIQQLFIDNNQKRISKEHVEF